MRPYLYGAAPDYPRRHTHTWKHLELWREAWHRSSKAAAVARSDQPSPRAAVHLAAADRRRERGAVDREGGRDRGGAAHGPVRRRDGARGAPAPAAAAAAAAGGGRRWVGHAVPRPRAARGGPAVPGAPGGENPCPIPLPTLSSPLPLRLHLLCFVASRPSPFVPEREIRQVIETYLTRVRTINSIRANAAGYR